MPKREMDSCGMQIQEFMWKNGMNFFVAEESE